MYCRECGQEIPQSSAFCAYCGTPVSAQPKQPNAPYRPADMYGRSREWEVQLPNASDNDHASWDYAAQYPQKNSASQPKWKLPAIIALCCVLAVTLVVVTILVMNILNGKPDTSADPSNFSGSSADSGNDTKMPIDQETPDMPADPNGAEEDDSPVRSDLPLVTDAFFDDSHRNSYGGVFAIPQINLEGRDIASINEEIYRELYTNLAADLLWDWDENKNDSTSISYTWSETGDTLSLLIKVRPVHWEMTDYYVYNVSISEGKELSDDEVIDRSGISNYRRIVKQGLETTFWENYYASLAEVSASVVEFFNEQLDRTRSDSVIDDARPYFNQAGELCVIAKIYAIAGADYYLHAINLEDYDYDPKYAGYAEVPSSDDYIIPDSNSRKISQSELYGLSEHECWLALNEIYARHGRLFTRQEFADYFNSKSWYNGYIDSAVFDNNLSHYLNSIEQENIATIVAYQKAMGWRENQGQQ